MFFVVSKVAWYFATPSNALVALVFLGAALAFTRFWRIARAATLVGAAGLAVAGLLPLGSLLLVPLEDRFPVLPQDAPPPDGIVVLGGGIDEYLTAMRGPVALNEAGARMTEGAALALKYPGARLVFTGGSAAILRRDVSEADAAEKLWLSLGLPASRMTFERRSRNTYENAIFTRDLVAPKPGERWVLVTSAHHMPRAVGIFRRAGWPVVADPVDFRTFGGGRDGRPPYEAASALRNTDTAMREWIGLAAYWLTGRTDRFLPGPDQS